MSPPQQSALPVQAWPAWKQPTVANPHVWRFGSHWLMPQQSPLELHIPPGPVQVASVLQWPPLQTSPVQQMLSPPQLAPGARQLLNLLTSPGIVVSTLGLSMQAENARAMRQIEAGLIRISFLNRGATRGV